MVNLAWTLVLLAAHIADAQPPTHPCRRQYLVEEKRAQQLADLGYPRGAVASIGTSDLARRLGFEVLPYSRSQERAFSARMEQVKIHATPWLHFGRDLFDFGQTNPAATHGTMNDTHAMYFYGNHFVDLSLFTHFFAKPEPVYGGTYVEIGGGNGVHASNTLFFEQHLNWKGYLIEPTPCSVCMLPVTRPRDINIKAGCCINSSILDGSFMKGFCPGGQDSCILNAKMGGYGAYTAPCDPMSTLLKSSDDGKLPPQIDFLSIDVEENYMAVLESWPWEHTAVDVMIVEVAMDPNLQKKLDAGTPKHKHSAAYKEQAKNDLARVRAYLENKGYHVLQEHFQYDLVAVRKACLA